MRNKTDFTELISDKEVNAIKQNQDHFVWDTSP